MKIYNQIDTLLKNDKVMQKVSIFDYIGIHNYLDNFDNKLYEQKNVNIFKKAYILFKLHRIYESYIELENISNFVKNKNNLLFVISEYNRLQIGDVLNRYDLETFVADDIIDKELQRIHNSIKEIRVEYLIDNYLTYEEQKIVTNKLKNDNLLFYKNKLLKLSDSVDGKVINLSGNKYYHTEIYRDYVLNYIFIENNDSYKEIFYNSLKLLLQDIKNIKEDIAKDTTILNNNRFCGKPQEYVFNYYDIFIMLEFLTSKQLKKIFDISGLDTILFKDTEKLFEAYEKLIDSIVELEMQNEYKYKEYVRKFFIIFSKIEITQSNFTQIITLYMKLLKKFTIYPNDADLYKHLMNFIIELFNNTDKRKFIDITILEKLFISLYKKTIKDFSENEYIIRNALNRVIRNLSNIIKELDIKYKSPLKSLTNIQNISYLQNFYIPMYFMLNKNLQNNIKTAVNDNLKNSFSIDLFYDSCIGKIIKTTDEYEDKLLEETISKIELYYERKENPRTETCGKEVYKVIPDHEKDDAENAISSIADLINYGRIKNIKKYLELLKYTEFNTTKYLSFVLDMENFDFNKFEVSYIHFLTPTKTKELKRILNNNKKAKNLVKEKILNQIDIKTKFNDIYMKNKIYYILFDK